MIYWLLAGAYLIVAWLGGIPAVLLLMAIGSVGVAVIFAADTLHEWNRARAERRAVYRRWAAWEYQDWLRRHTRWRS